MQEPETQSEYDQYLGELAAETIDVTETLEGGVRYRDRLTEEVFDTADVEVEREDLAHSLRVLEHSNNGPREWKHLISEDDSYRDVIRALAFDALRIDLWEEIDKRLDD